MYNLLNLIYNIYITYYNINKPLNSFIIKIIFKYYLNILIIILKILNNIYPQISLDFSKQHSNIII